MEQFWSQALEKTELAESDRILASRSLSRLEPSQIEQWYEVDNASIKTRFEMLAHIDLDANIHTYKEILPRTFNLVIKQQPSYDTEWILAEFEEAGYTMQALVRDNVQAIKMSRDKQEMELQYLQVKHKRNGLYLTLQFPLPPQDF
jgi:hypothetical protein